MAERFTIITNPENIKSGVYARLGYAVSANGLYAKGAFAEERFDRALGIGLVAPFMPGGHKGLPYVVGAALEKLMIAYDDLDEPSAATDACWFRGSFINKPGENIDGAVKWWTDRLNADLYNIGGLAVADPLNNDIRISAMIVRCGRINPRVTVDELRRSIYDCRNSNSGGINFTRALDEGLIVVPGDEIAWRKVDFGRYKRQVLETMDMRMNRRYHAKVVDSGKLRMDRLHEDKIIGMMFGVTPL